MTFGWGNPDWAASSSYLQAVARQAVSSKGAVVECGSGLSTVVLSYVCADNRAVVALEHDPMWVELVNRRCRRGTTPVVHAQLVDHGEFGWYEVPQQLPEGVALIVCDGPPSNVKGGRYGGLALLSDRLCDDWVLLLDDAERQAESATLERWAQEFNVEYQLVSEGDRPYARVRPAT